jgi:hypothetical protein
VKSFDLLKQDYVVLPCRRFLALPISVFAQPLAGIDDVYAHAFTLK